MGVGVGVGVKERRPISSPTYYDDGSLKCGSLQSRSKINNAPRFDIHQIILELQTKMLNMTVIK